MAKALKLLELLGIVIVHRFFCQYLVYSVKTYIYNFCDCYF